MGDKTTKERAARRRGGKEELVGEKTAEDPKVPGGDKRGMVGLLGKELGGLPKRAHRAGAEEGAGVEAGEESATL